MSTASGGSNRVWDARVHLGPRLTEGSPLPAPVTSLPEIVTVGLSRPRGSGRVGSWWPRPGRRWWLGLSDPSLNAAVHRRHVDLLEATGSIIQVQPRATVHGAVEAGVDLLVVLAEIGGRGGLPDLAVGVGDPVTDLVGALTTDGDRGFEAKVSGQFDG